LTTAQILPPGPIARPSDHECITEGFHADRRFNWVANLATCDSDQSDIPSQ
jgi:hypothetical protein